VTGKVYNSKWKSECFILVQIGTALYRLPGSQASHFLQFTILYYISDLHNSGFDCSLVASCMYWDLTRFSITSNKYSYCGLLFRQPSHTSLVPVHLYHV
jgi:hypothetical protein